MKVKNIFSILSAMGIKSGLKVSLVWWSPASVSPFPHQPQRYLRTFSPYNVQSNLASTCNLAAIYSLQTLVFRRILGFQFGQYSVLNHHHGIENQLSLDLWLQLLIHTESIATMDAAKGRDLNATHHLLNASDFRCCQFQGGRHLGEECQRVKKMPWHWHPAGVAEWAKVVCNG